ncbi:TasA family protein [Cellulomonas sp.]|uniref:TasA family protein n=1 Tax=Cellulomonas sp. TaxID=40001 RepID=UPI00258A10EC|nr:TasA family protein [Cellulomonas sp.]MCR6689094.1 CalY family protein [Cellulomonas sp.]
MDDLLQEMVSPAPAPGERARRRRLWATVTIVGLAALGVTSLTTSAFFRDDATTNSAITAGTISIDSADLAFSIPVGNMLPGASVVSPVTVSNEGSLRYQYAIQYDATDRAGDTANLSSALHLSIYRLDAADCTLANASGSTARLGQSAGTWGLATSATDIVGEAGTDAALGNRQISASSSEDLCVRVDFDPAADNSYQDTQTELTLRFAAMQLTFDPADPNESNT